MMFRGMFHDPAYQQHLQLSREKKDAVRAYKKQPEKRRAMITLAIEKEWKDELRQMLDYKATGPSLTLHAAEQVIALRSDSMLDALTPHDLPMIDVFASAWPTAIRKLLCRYDFHYNGAPLYKALSQAKAGAEVIALTLAHGRQITPAKFLTAAAVNYPALLDETLKAVTLAGIAPNDLAKAAGGIIANGRADAAALLAQFIDAGMNVNYNEGELLQKALLKGDTDIAAALVAAGCEARLYAENIGAALLSEGAPRAAVEWLRPYNTALEPAAGDGFALVDAGSVAMTQSLPMGGRLTMVFNFALSQQIVIAQAGEQLAAPTVVPFSQIENRQQLQAAAEALQRLGGDAALAAAGLGAAPAPRLLQGVKS